jgi:hypothetical protein
MIRRIGIVFITIIIITQGLYGQSKIIRQIVENWPPGLDTTGICWCIYDPNEPELDVQWDTSAASATLYSSTSNRIRWSADVANFGGSIPYAIGDTLIAFGSWDSAYATNPGTYDDNINHRGYYWIYSDTIGESEPWSWEPGDTLRIMPFPSAAQVDTSIVITIENPQETRYSGQTTYDVLGFWLMADTSGNGTPGHFDRQIAFIPVQGNAGDTTTYSHPVSGNYASGQTVYWAYHLVARPDTGGTGCPGYASHYLSGNSNPLVIIGIDEINQETPGISNVTIFPNPFTSSTRISFMSSALNALSVITIYNAEGRYINTLVNSTGERSVLQWNGQDAHGEQVTPGVYFVQIETQDNNGIHKIVKLK